MAITQQQYEDHFVARRNQIETLVNLAHEALSDWDRVQQHVNPANDVAQDLTLNTVASRIKARVNARRQGLIDAATAFTAIP